MQKKKEEKTPTCQALLLEKNQPTAKLRQLQKSLLTTKTNSYETQQTSWLYPRFLN